MYPEHMRESIKNVERTRPERLKIAKASTDVYKRMSEDELNHILDTYHPDYKDDALQEVRIGPNKGEKLTTEVTETLESYSRIKPENFDLNNPDYETDVLVIGGGSAGFAAVLLASENGASVILNTKLRLGDSNSMMAQGGIQAAVLPEDSPPIHYLDAIGGGHFSNKPELVKALTMDAPKSIKWLSDMGVMFDRNEDGSMKLKPGGGTSRKRMHSARDYTGAAICSTLRDEVQNKTDKIQIMEHQAAVELIMDKEGKVAGAVLYHLENREYHIVKAKSTIIATGGFGRLHVRNYETTNHYGATADGLVMAYRVGANLLFMDSVQYHPTGAVYPEQIVGFLCTEKLRSLGAQPVNKNGELFVHPLEPRDVEASAFIRECVDGKGIKTALGRDGIWLDSPIINKISGPGTIEKNLPAMVRQFARFGIDIVNEPILVYPTLHYQNGGVEINEHCETKIPGLYVAGEATGGVHGRNRLMGNSQLDIIVFGRRAGKYAAEYAKGAKLGKLTLDHVHEYNKMVEGIGIDEEQISPMVLPDYIPDFVKERQYSTKYQGTLR